MNLFLHPLLAAMPHEMWNSLTDILLLLGLAMILGAVAELLRQSAIVGYLIAGTIIGPSVLGLVSQQQDIFQIAELGVALLLFTIGLEFSVKRLLSLGKVPLLSGALQVLLTLVVGAILSWGVGLRPMESIVVGAMVALSSTACVLRILTDRAEIDSPYGRMSLGILLVQDAAVVPLMLLVTMLTAGDTVLSIVWQLAAALAAAFVLIAALYVFFTYAAPSLLKLTNLQRNRDLPILLAVVMAMGSAWAAQRFGLSPALGAFVAGVLLGASPFAVQIRADIEPLKTILVTLFFAAVGMFGDAGWFFHHVGLVCTVVMAIVSGKVVLAFLAARLCGARREFAIATALCLAQVGEFSFVFATIAYGSGGDESILSDTTFRALVAATIISLLITPYLIAVAPRAGAWFEQSWQRLRTGRTGATDTEATQRNAATDREPGPRDWIFIIGFGPAGQRAAEDLIASHQDQLVIIDINTDNIQIAERYGLMAHLGDATQSEILEHAGIHRASVVIITVPTPFTSRRLVHLARHHAAGAMIFARCRYHMHRWQLAHAGAHVVVDEEDRVGHELAARVLEVLHEPEVD